MTAVVRERPILFSGPMVRRVMDGSKTQTRRLVKPAPPSIEAVHAKSGTGFSIFTKRHDAFRVAGPVWAVRDLLGREPEWRCPYGAPGDRLWVRETFYCDHCFAGDYRTTWSTGAVGRPPEIDRAACEREWRGEDDGGSMMYYRADVPSGEFEDAGYWAEPGGRWRPSIFMPRWASRLSLDVLEIRVERVQDITEDDARAEGAAREFVVDAATFMHGTTEDIDRATSYRNGFASLWREINGAASWDANPWVWVIGFQRTAFG